MLLGWLALTFVALGVAICYGVVVTVALWYAVKGRLKVED